MVPKLTDDVLMDAAFSKISSVFGTLLSFAFSFAFSFVLTFGDCSVVSFVCSLAFGTLVVDGSLVVDPSVTALAFSASSLASFRAGSPTIPAPAPDVVGILSDDASSVLVLVATVELFVGEDDTSCISTYSRKRAMWRSRFPRRENLWRFVLIASG